MPKKLTKRGKLNPRKGLHWQIKELMTKVYELIKNYENENKRYNCVIILEELGYNRNKMIAIDYEKKKGQLKHMFDAARDISKLLIKYMSGIFEQGNQRTVIFMDFEGNTLTKSEAEKMFRHLLDLHKIPYAYYNRQKKTMEEMTTFLRIENIINPQIIQTALQLENKLGEAINFDATIKITGRKAVDTALPIKAIHQQMLVNGIKLKERSKNIWEKDTKKQNK